MKGYQRVRTLGGPDESSCWGLPLAWADDGLCSTGQFDPDLWFPAEGDHDAQDLAVSVCRTCPVRQTCLEYAIEEKWLEGIWGGVTPKIRSRLRRAGLRRVSI